MMGDVLFLKNRHETLGNPVIMHGSVFAFGPLIDAFIVQSVSLWVPALQGAWVALDSGPLVTPSYS